MASSCITSRSATLLSSNTIFIGNSLQGNKECTKLCAQRGSWSNPCSGTVEALEIYSAQFAGELVTFWYEAGNYDDPSSEASITFPPTISGAGNGAVLQNAGGYVFEVISDLGRKWQNFTFLTSSVVLQQVDSTATRSLSSGGIVSYFLMEVITILSIPVVIAKDLVTIVDNKLSQITDNFYISIQNSSIAQLLTSTQVKNALSFNRTGSAKTQLQMTGTTIVGKAILRDEGLGPFIAELDGDFQNLILELNKNESLTKFTLAGRFIYYQDPVVLKIRSKSKTNSRVIIAKATIEGDIQNDVAEAANGTLEINGVQITGSLYNQIKDSATGTTTITEAQVLGKMQTELDDLASGDFTVYNSVVTNDGTAVQVIMNSTGQYIESFTNSSLYQKYKPSSSRSAVGEKNPEFTVPLVSSTGTQGQGTRNWANVNLYAKTVQGVPVVEEMYSGNYSQRTTESGNQTTQTGAGDGWLLHLLDTATLNETSSQTQVSVTTGSSTRKYIDEGAALFGNYQGNTATQTQVSTNPLKYKLIKGTYKRNGNHDIENANTSSTAVLTEQQGGESNILSYNGTVENPNGAGISMTFSGDATGTYTDTGRVATAKGAVQSFDASALDLSSAGVTVTASNGLLKSSDPTKPALQIIAPATASVQPAVVAAPKVSYTGTAMQMNAPAIIQGQVIATLVNFASQGLNNAAALSLSMGANVRATVASFASTYDQDGDGTASTILVDGATAVLQSVNATKTSGGYKNTGPTVTATNGGAVKAQVVTLETDVEDSAVVSAQDKSTFSLSQIIATISGADNGLSFLDIAENATGSVQTARVLGRKNIAGGSGKLNVATNVANTDGGQNYAPTLTTKVEANTYVQARNSTTSL